MVTETSSLVGQTLGQGRYQVKRKLGEGGMAFVLLAHDVNVEVDVVLKVPKPIILADPEFAHRFKREIRSMVELTHPHIVKIKDVGEHDGMPFYVMDLLTGGSLEDRFEVGPDKKKKPMPAESLSDWLEPVAGALDFINQKFVHRDIKPANILFDSFNNAFVSDFGIVKALDASEKKQTVMTQAGMVIGTAPYIAPEVTEGKKYDGRADQYALAATVYEALSGRVPFDGDTLPAIIMQQLTGKIPPLHELAPGLPATLMPVIEKGLSQDPKNRYANCSAFARAVLAAVKAAAPADGARVKKRSGAPQAVCPACKKAFALPQDPTGKSITCPGCGTGFTVRKRSTDQAKAETSRSSSPATETRARRNEETPGATPAAAPTGIDLAKAVPRRVWIGVVIAIVLAALGLLLVGGVIVLIVFLMGRGSRGGEKNRA